MIFSRRGMVLFVTRILTLFSGSVIAAPNGVEPGIASSGSGASNQSLALRLFSIRDLRALFGPVSTNIVSVAGWSESSLVGGGDFRLDLTDNTTIDNGGTVIVDRARRRWKRVLPDDQTLTPQMFGAKGNGAADDTGSLQDALNYVVSNGGRLVIPGGRYRVTSPLAIGDSGTVYKGGFSIEGVARATPGWNGTLIWLDAVGVSAVLIWKRTAWRNGTLRNIGLASSVMDGATYGLLIESSEISDIHFDGLDIGNVTTAIGLHQGTGSNGEFCSFANVWTWNVLNFFHSTAGQAFGIDINHVFCYHRGGGDLFVMDPPIVGGGLVVRAFNATPTDPKKRAHVSNTTLLKLRQKHNAPIIFEGGRIEHLTCVIDVDQTAQDGIVNTPIKFIGTQFTMDNIDGEITKTTHYAMILERTPPCLITFDTCQFSTFKSIKTIFVVKAGEGMRGTLRFMMCDFNGFSRLPSVEMGFNTIQEVQFENCIGNPVSTDGTMAAIGLPVKFSRNLGGGGAAQRITQASACTELQSGMSTNYLLVPQFRAATGSARAVPCDPPWAHFGAKLTLGTVRDWSANENGVGPRSSSPFAKYITIFPNSGIFQDILQISLARPNTSIGGVGVVFGSYRALLNRIGGRCRLRFALENNTTHQVYDEIRFDGAGVTSIPQIVALFAVIQTTEVGSLRLKIENQGPGEAVLDFAYQFLADTARATFSSTVEKGSNDGIVWSTNAESGRFYSRLSLPHKSDLYGRSANPPFDAITSDIYLSADSERLVYHANGLWWDVPRTTYANQPPISGAWSRGDVIYNLDPKPGGHVGWICVEGGSPGLWSLFGAIES